MIVVHAKAGLRVSFVAFAGLVAFAAEPGSEAAPVIHVLDRPHALSVASQPLSPRVAIAPLIEPRRPAKPGPLHAALPAAKQPAPVPVVSLAHTAPIAHAPLIRLDLGVPAVGQAELTASVQIVPAPDVVSPAAAPTVQLAAAHRDERAYVPQITDAGREAYIAQLGVDTSPTRMAVRMDGKVLGKVAFQVADGHVSVRVGQVLDLFESGFDTARFAALRGSTAADQFVSLERIQRAGVPLHYDPVYDELVLG
jgi:hypothetical protein